MSGLVVSSIDKWFIGPVPQLAPHDLGLGGEDKDLPSVLQRARAVLDDPAQLASPSVECNQFMVSFQAELAFV
jgi:anaphase-promoting complex subunit 4